MRTGRYIPMRLWHVRMFCASDCGTVACHHLRNRIVGRWCIDWRGHRFWLGEWVPVELANNVVHMWRPVNRKSA